MRILNDYLCAFVYKNSKKSHIDTFAKILDLYPPLLSAYLTFIDKDEVLGQAC